MRQGTGVTAMVRPRAPMGMAYEEFSPISEWKEEENSRVLLVCLPGFRKEQLKVATEGTNYLRVQGERLIGGRKRSHFHEQYQIPTDCTIKGIHAKFETGFLTITMPKIKILQEGPKAEEANITQNPEGIIDKPKDEALQGNKDLGEASKTTLTSEKEDDKEKYQEPMEKKDKKETLEEKENSDEKIEPAESKELDAAMEDARQYLTGIGKKEMGNEIGGSKVEELKKAMKRLTGVGLKAKREYLVNIGLGAIVIVALGAYISYAFGFYEEIPKPYVDIALVI